MSLKHTALHDVHEKLGAKMVEFAGFHMPVQYTGIREEHRRVRETVGIFDVSHMGEIEISGSAALKMVQKITINDASVMPVGRAQYSAMCYENGGIIDDMAMYCFADKYLLVVNGANLSKDYQWILDNKIENCTINNISDRFSQLAVQGKKAEAVLQKLTKVNLSAIKFYWYTEGELTGVPMIISRTGYTGEPGFEIYFDNQYAIDVWDKIMAAGKEFQIQPIGLAARDSLRLEKKMCLYGNDIDETTNPLEAGLGWITKMDKGDFIGRDALLKIKEEGITRKLVAFTLEESGFPRKGYKIFKNGNEVGEVTSGTVSPMLDKGIGMGYVAKAHSGIGVEIEIELRGKQVPAQIIKPPFV